MIQSVAGIPTHIWVVGIIGHFRKQIVFKRHSITAAKNASELSSTTPQFYNADSCEDGATGEKDDANNSNNDSDEDLVVDDDCVRVSRKRKLDGDAGG